MVAGGDDGMQPLLDRQLADVQADTKWLEALDRRFAEIDEQHDGDDTMPAPSARTGVGDQPHDQALTEHAGLPPLDNLTVGDQSNQASVVSEPVPVADVPPLPDLSEPLVRIAAENGVRDRDLLRMDRFVRAVILDGKPVHVAGREVGWSIGKVDKVVNRSPAYQAMRAELLRRVTRTRDDVQREVYNVVTDTAIVGAHRQNHVLKTTRNEQLVHVIAEDAMDRVGARAPAQAEVKHQVELSEATLALFDKALAAHHVRQPLLEGEWAFATERPVLDDDRAMASVGGKPVANGGDDDDA